jgi:hypothetical protein
MKHRHRSTSTGMSVRKAHRRQTALLESLEPRALLTGALLADLGPNAQVLDD